MCIRDFYFKNMMRFDRDRMNYSKQEGLNLDFMELGLVLRKRFEVKHFLSPFRWHYFAFLYFLRMIARAYNVNLPLR
jgi:hypothetical protein